jgi:pyridoxal phosphate enzyme (YggS family)
MQDDLITNLRAVHARIQQACARSGRDAEEVQLLLATKTVPAERIRLALQAGVTLIAENKIQELKDKFDALQDAAHTNHFIGHLQTNKIKELLRYDVTCMQSLDRLDLAEKLSSRLAFEKKTLDVLIQVNTSQEESKFGIHPDDAVAFTRQVAQFRNLHIKGLMTIGLFSAEADKVRACFKLLRRVQQEIMAADIPNVAMQELSMGMSSDLEIAIEEGATIVRVGTSIFGARSTPDTEYWNENA